MSCVILLCSFYLLVLDSFLRICVVLCCLLPACVLYILCDIVRYFLKHTCLVEKKSHVLCSLTSVCWQTFMVAYSIVDIHIVSTHFRNSLVLNH